MLTMRSHPVGRLLGVAGLAALTTSLVAPGSAGATSGQVCTGRSIRFISGTTPSSDTLSFGVTLPAGVYDAMLVTADSYPERAETDPSGQQTEIVEVAGIVSHDLVDGVVSVNDITYGTFVAPAPFSSLTAYHRASTPGPNSVWVSTFCLTPSSAPTTQVPTTLPTTTAPSTTTSLVPTTPVTSTTVAPTIPASTSLPPSTATPTTVPLTTVPLTTLLATTVPSTTVPSTTVPSTTAAPSSTTEPTLVPEGGSTVGPTTTAGTDLGDPFGVGDPIPAGPELPDRMSPAAPTSGPGSLSFTGMGLGVVLLGAVLVALGVTTAGSASKLDAAGHPEEA